VYGPGWSGRIHKAELACYQHDGSDRRCKYAQHQIVGVIYRFAFLFEPEGIRSTTGASDGDWDARTVGSAHGVTDRPTPLAAPCLRVLLQPICPAMLKTVDHVPR
jgi:hypothetical protein